MSDRLDARAIARLGAVVAALLLAAPAAAQDRPAPAVEFAAGTLLFADDTVVSEGFVGGAARFYLSPRISLGPEIASVHGNNHRHLMSTGNVTIDLLGPVNGAPRPVTPFVVAGAGLFRTHESFPSGSFTSTEGSFTAGGGVRALVGKHLIVGGEVRVGWELHLRVNGMIGVRLGR